ncbi:hypothetical protein ACIP5Y_22800 [Nocardia sp. NPDC088792]|uniref:hypothetical protein n=1 Tax=Nocardia sp. NPDC088792 TaxID=3364332 RepID=UPI0037F9ED58
MTVPGGRLDIEWDSGSAAGDAVVDLPAGARLSLMIARGNTDVLAAVAPDALDSLLLFDTPVSAPDVATIAQLTGLSALMLFDTGIGADAIAQLSQLTGLQQLSIESMNPDGGTPPDAAVGAEASEAITTVLQAERRARDRVSAYLTVRIGDGYHLYAPDAAAEQPLTISTDTESGWEITKVVAPATSDGHLTGTTLLAIELTGTANALTLHLRAQACRPDSCLPPTTLHAHTEVHAAH